MNIEHQSRPVLSPDNDWVEIDHASANVSYDTEVNPEVLEFFELVVDPTDPWNKWVRPMAGVRVIGEQYADEMDRDGMYRYAIRLPDGRESYLICEETEGGYWRTRLEHGNQLTFDV